MTKVKVEPEWVLRVEQHKIPLREKACPESIPLGGNCMAKRSHNEVQESLRELTRIFRPKDPRKFVKDYIRKYRITGGYEDELTVIVERELVKLNTPAS